MKASRITTGQIINYPGDLVNGPLQGKVISIGRLAGGIILVTPTGHICITPNTQVEVSFT
jgi:hypothetical protein